MIALARTKREARWPGERGRLKKGGTCPWCPRKGRHVGLIGRKGRDVSGRKKGRHVAMVKTRFEKGGTSPRSGRREKGRHVAMVGRGTRCGTEAGRGCH